MKQDVQLYSLRYIYIQINTVQVSKFLKTFKKRLIRCLINKTRWRKYICGSHKSRKYDLLSIREGNKGIYFLRIPSVFTLECYESILRVECGMLSCFRTSLFPSNTLCISFNNLYYIILFTRNNIHVLNLLTKLWNNIVYRTTEHLLLFAILLRLLQTIISTDYPNK